jgi:hypothetical protein
MKKNIGDDDKIIRLVSAALFIVLYLQGIVKHTAGIILLIPAGILIVTSLVGSCGLYSLLKINTNYND